MRDSVGWRGIWIIIGVGALIIFILRFSLPESPRWLATHGHGQRALDLLQRMGLRTVPLEILSVDEASHGRVLPFSSRTKRNSTLCRPGRATGILLLAKVRWRRLAAR